MLLNSVDKQNDTQIRSVFGKMEAFNNYTIFSSIVGMKILLGTLKKMAMKSNIANFL